LPIGRVEAKSAAGLVYHVYVEGLNEMARAEGSVARAASTRVSHILLLFVDALEWCAWVMYLIVLSAGIQ
jgi:hypothetical protein